MRLRTSRLALVSLIACLGVAAPASAQVVVDGGAPNEGIAWNIFNDFQASAMFSVSGPISFDAIRFWGLMADGAAYDPTMYWQILMDDGGSPGATVALGGSAPSTSTFRKELTLFPGFSSWEFDFDTGPESLGAGVYWLVLHDGPLDVNDFTNSGLVWEMRDAPGESAIQTFTVDDHWDVVPDVGVAFQLLNNPVSTPEPATVVLVGSGLVALAAMRRRRRRRRI